jgi:hypothetical protein
LGIVKSLDSRGKEKNHRKQILVQKIPKNSGLMLVLHVISIKKIRIFRPREVGALKSP